jgi:glycosyltransferase involved in cell wall biosynthesis
VRILFANDGLGDAGGVQSYLEAVTRGLDARGYELAFFHCGTETAAETGRFPAGMTFFGGEGVGAASALESARAWAPDLCFSHNMNSLGIEEQFQQAWPVVKLMHGYFGTCVGGLKTTNSMFGPRPCGRTFGPACLAHYLPRRCGQLSLSKMLRQYRWAARQNNLFAGYAALVVASQHMRREYVANGAPAERVHVAPLFPTGAGARRPKGEAAGARRPPHVLFLGRMTKLKGGDVLIRAVAEAARREGLKIQLTLAGDGPQRAAWELLGRELGVACRFTGWVNEEERQALLDEASLLAVPSVWPEPFGLVGLEAARAGVPAVAFDVGGIAEWLKDGVNGLLADASPPDHRSLAAALVKALGSPECLGRMAAAARRVAGEMSLQKHLDILEGIFHQAVSARPPLTRLAGARAAGA